MAARITPSAGGKPDKLMRDALILELNATAKDANGKPTKKLRLIARKLCDIAIEGEVAAIKEISDRVDGRPAQALEHTGKDGKPIELLDVTDEARARALAALMARTKTKDGA